MGPQVTDFKLEYPPGATPLNPNEIAGIRLSGLKRFEKLEKEEI